MFIYLFMFISMLMSIHLSAMNKDLYNTQLRVNFIFHCILTVNHNFSYTFFAFVFTNFVCIVTVLLCVSLKVAAVHVLVDLVEMDVLRRNLVQIAFV